jgi:hypothetical protein
MSVAGRVNIPYSIKAHSERTLKIVKRRWSDGQEAVDSDEAEQTIFD